MRLLFLVDCLDMNISSFALSLEANVFFFSYQENISAVYRLKSM